MKRATLLWGWLCMGIAGFAYSAPVDLAPPPTVFENVTEQGFVSLNQEFGSVELDKSFSFPLRVLFDSNQDSSSPYCGKGWAFTLMESTVFPVNPTLTKVRLPCGKIMLFHQTKKDPKAFSDRSGEWIGRYGEGESGLFTISRKDGWQLSYRDGHLFQIRTDAGHVFTWSADANKATISGVEGVTPLSMARDETDPEVWRLDVGVGDAQQHFRFHSPKIPSFGTTLTEVSHDQTVVRHFKWELKGSVPSLSWTDSFGNWNPISWDGTTRQILSDNAWRYTITPLKDENDTAEITRTHANGAVQYYYNDRKTGVLTSRTGKDEKKIYFFVSAGPLLGKTRMKEETKDGKTTVTYRAFYDDKGQLIKWTGADDVAHIENYDASGVRTFETEGKNGPVSWGRKYDDQGRLILSVAKDGGKISIAYGENGEKTTTTLQPGAPATVQVIKDGRVISFETVGVEKISYNDDGTVESRKDAAGNLDRFVYDGKRGLKEVTRNGAVISRQLCTKDGVPAICVSYDSQGTVTGGLDVRSNKTLSAEETLAATSHLQ